MQSEIDVHFQFTHTTCVSIPRFCALHHHIFEEFMLDLLSIYTLELTKCSYVALHIVNAELNI